MKKIYILILLQNILLNGFSQINLENTYSLPHFQEHMRIINFGNGNYKFANIDYDGSQFSLYNMNHTPFLLNISVPLLTDTGAYEISYISSTLFDCDSTNIEYALMTTAPDPNRKFFIYRTDGTLIFSRDSVTMPYCSLCGAGGADVEGITNTTAGTKMFLFNSTNQWFVYGLCGNLPQSIEEINQTDTYVKVFPNPATQYINFQITPPSNFATCELIILNSAFQTVKTDVVKGQSNLNMNVQNFVPGIYFYTLQNRNKILQTGKFIKQN